MPGNFIFTHICKYTCVILQVSKSCACEQGLLDFGEIILFIFLNGPLNAKDYCCKNCLFQVNKKNFNQLTFTVKKVEFVKI